MDVLGAEAQADDAGGDAAEDGEIFQEKERKREFGDWGFEGQGGADEAFVGDDLEGLSHAGWEGAAGLDFVQMGVECVEICVELWIAIVAMRVAVGEFRAELFGGSVLGGDRLVQRQRLRQRLR